MMMIIDINKIGAACGQVEWFDDDDDDDDIYIYYDEVSVCLCAYNEKSSLSPSELSAGGAKRDARQALPAVGRLWPSDDDDDDDDDEQD